MFLNESSQSMSIGPWRVYEGVAESFYYTDGGNSWKESFVEWTVKKVELSEQKVNWIYENMINWRELWISKVLVVFL